MPEHHPQPEGRQGSSPAGTTFDGVDDIAEDDVDADDATESEVEDLDVEDDTEHIQGGAPLDGKGNDPF